MDPSKRPPLGDTLLILRRNFDSILSELSTIHSNSEDVDINVNVSEQTQASVNALTDVEKFFSQTTCNDQTKFHNQKNTNLCHSYSTMSALRFVLGKFFVGKIKNKTLLTSVLKTLKPRKKSSFYKMLAVFIGCINPRTFESMFKNGVDKQIWNYFKNFERK